MKVSINISSKSLDIIKDVMFDALTKAYDELDKDEFDSLYYPAEEIGVNLHPFGDFEARYAEDQEIGKADFEADMMRDQLNDL